MEASDTPCVLLLDLTPSALAGIDLLSFTTSARFNGIKDIPSGFHFVFCSTTSDLSVRHGAWFQVLEPSKSTAPGLFVKNWNGATEQMDAETDETRLLRWRANLGSLWKENLSPYRQSASEDAPQDVQSWASLTSSISASLLTTILGNSPDHWTLTSASSAVQDLEAIPGLSAHSNEILSEKELNFLPIDLKSPWRQGATGRERTEAARDHSWYLREVIRNDCIDGDTDHILGEMQFCFLMVLSLNNYSCLEQWKRIISLLLTCTSAVSELSDLYVKMLALLRLQLKHCQVAEGGLFDLADESGSLLKQLLHKFKLAMKDISGIGKSDVMDELDELENYLRGEHNWQIDGNFVRKGLLELEDGEKVEMEMTGYDEEDESGEYAPTMVELSEEMMTALGITSTDLAKLQKHAVPTQHVESEISEDDQDLEDMDVRY